MPIIKNIAANTNSGNSTNYNNKNNMKISVLLKFMT